MLAGFVRELRLAGITAGTGDLLTYTSAMAPLDPTDLVDLYWAGRTTLVSRRDDIAIYDEVFRRYFLAEGTPAAALLTLRAAAAAEAEAALVMPGTEPGPEQDEQQPVLGWMASDVAALKHRSFSACTPAELAALRRIMARIRLTPPAAAHSPQSPGGGWPHPRSPRDYQELDAHARRAVPAVLPAAQDPAPPADPHTRRVRLDDGLLPPSAAVRPLGEARGGQG